MCHLCSNRRRELSRVALVIAIAVLTTSCSKLRKTTEFTIAEGVSGWVEIEFERADCPPLKESATRIFVTIPRSGHACTSSEFFSGVGFSEYYLDSKPDRTLLPSGLNDPNRMIWGDRFTRTLTKKTYMFFVGSADEWEARKASR